MRFVEIEDGAALYMAEMSTILRNLPLGAISQVTARLDRARREGQVVYTCGNGGSAATAIHFASDLAKGAKAPGSMPFRALALCENISLLTAWSNDASYEESFAQQLAPWVKSLDVLVAFSCSGNSRNVLRALEEATRAGATTIVFTGSAGGAVQELADIWVAVPADNPEQAEDIHLMICHHVTRSLREFPRIAS